MKPKSNYSIDNLNITRLVQHIEEQDKAHLNMGFIILVVYLLFLVLATIMNWFYMICKDGC
jgi:CHASE3 domain sensor protein